MISRRLSVGVLSLALAITAWAARKPGSPLKPGFNLFSKQDDVQVGQENANKVLAQYEVVKNPFLQDYVRKLGQKLAAAPEAKASGFTFTFTVLNVDEINAFALPGGPMFIYTGLLKACDNEAQLAGVMGHEMSHVILRHGTHEATKANVVGLLAGGAGALLGGGKLAESVLGLGANSVVLKFSRDAETEADALGSHLMAASGYDPVQMAKFFEKLAAGGQHPPQILSDHPNPGNREAAIQAEVRTLPSRKYDAQSGEFSRMKREAAALPPPVKKPAANAPAPGASVPPPGAPADWQRYQGTGYTIDYPKGWQVFSHGSDVTLAPKDGVVAQSGALGFGAMISMFTPQPGRTDLRSASADLIKRLTGDNHGMTISGSPQTRSVGGRDALVTTLKSESPFGGVEIDTVVTVSREPQLWYAIFVAPEKDQPRVEESFGQMMDSVKFAP